MPAPTAHATIDHSAPYLLMAALERGNGRLERYVASGDPTYGLDLAEFRTRIHRVAGID